MNTREGRKHLIPPEVDELYRNQVLYPWEQTSHDSESPWEATRELRRQWGDMLSSKKEAQKEVGAIALMRCSKLVDDEKGALLRFWQSGGFQLINTDLALSQLLLGASPPTVLFTLYFAQQEISFYQSNELAREELSRLTRHPALAKLADSLAMVAPMYGCGMSWGVNPLLSGPLVQELITNSNHWIRAAGLFNPQNPLENLLDSTLKSAALDIAALLLRPTLTPDEFDHVLSKAMPESIFEFLMLDHPAGSGKTCPTIDWSNPNREAIAFCGAQTYLGALWRYWNPLLTLPWLFDDLSEIEDPGFLVAQLLLGAQPEVLSQGHALDIGLVRRLRSDYPSLEINPA